MTTIPQAFSLAFQHHEAGRLKEADELYRQILAAAPNYAPAWHHLGLVAHQMGRHDLAEQWIREAIRLVRNDAAAWCNLGAVLMAQNRAKEALATFRRALELNPNYAEACNNLGNALNECGQVEDALAAYTRALAIKPQYWEASFNLGRALRKSGQREEAIRAFEGVLQIYPQHVPSMFELATALEESGRRVEAIEWFRRASELAPNDAEIWLNLGVTLAREGQHEESIQQYQRALELDPDSAEAHLNLGAALAELERFDEASAAIHRALLLEPDGAEAHNNLGNVLARQERGEEALEEYRRALEARPGFALGWFNIGTVCRDLVKPQDAIAAFHRALQIQPEYPEAFNNLGRVFQDQARLDEAIAAYRRAIELKPEYPEAFNNLGNALKDCGQLDAAVDAFRRALDLRPAYAAAHANLGNAFKDQGHHAQATAAYERSLEIEPEHALAHSNLVFSLHYRPDHDAATLAAEHRRWNARFSDPVKSEILPWNNSPDPERRLRIGYVSADFRAHPVTFFLVPLFEAHDHSLCEIFCYSSTRRIDSVTDRLRGVADAWREVQTWTDRRLAETIREDSIDILVDLSMHTASNRLPVFARKPAPVQVSWLAYPGSTGLDTMDYRLTDSYIDPPPLESGEDFPGGEPLRLPDAWCCYKPLFEFPALTPLPALTTGRVTFGSFNQFGKLNEPLFACWVRLLDAVPGSRLRIACPAGKAQERTCAFFARHGIELGRLELVAPCHWDIHKHSFASVDIALDSFPCNGMTTTCHALWMGVPTVTLSGKTAVSRAGASLLRTVGLNDWVAQTEEDYIRIAKAAAADLPRLATLRGSLRSRMQASPLMDAHRFARNVEAAYREIWDRWCASTKNA